MSFHLFPEERSIEGDLAENFSPERNEIVTWKNGKKQYILFASSPKQDQTV